MAKSKQKSQKIKGSDWRKLFFELIVVFLGVTAGFVLNNWQQEKKDEQLERKYLSGFLQDARANATELKTKIEADRRWLAFAEPKLKTVQKSTISSKNASSFIKQMFEISKLDAQTGTYKDIVNSGNLNIISDYDLKKQIVTYHLAISNVQFLDEYFYKFHNDYVMPFIFKNFELLNGKLENTRVIHTTRFTNVIAGYYSMVQQRENAYGKLLKRNRALIKTLDQLDLPSENEDRE